MTARSLPIWALAPLVLLALVVTIVQARRAGDEAAAFVIVAVGLRIILSSLHQFTYAASPIGLSWNAIASILVTLAGLLVIRRRAGMNLVLLALLPLLSVMIISAIVNRDPATAIGALTKFAYFAVIATLFVQASSQITPARLCRLLLPVTLIPLVYQIVGIPLGVIKLTENDGSASYIGGFNHEAAYSLLILTAVTVVCFADTLRFRARLLLIGWCLVALFLANYRTSILAVGPLLLVAMVTAGSRVFLPRQRAAISALLLVGVSIAGLALAVSQRDRFGDLALAYQYGSNLIQPPGRSSMEYRRLLSGRPALWSKYYYGWKEGTPAQKLVGFGPESWTKHFDLYAHNTLVSALFEIGVIGVLATLFLWLANLFYAMANLRNVDNWRLVAAHLSFLILNLATMPMWMIEGMILYAIICGLSVYQLRLALVRKRAPARLGPRRAASRPLTLSAE